MPESGPAVTERSVQVRAGTPYEVHIGAGVRRWVVELAADAQRVALLHPPTLATLAGELVAALRAAGHEVLIIEVPDSERAKTADVLVDTWGRLGAAGFTRSDVVVGLGGGATTDLAGFVAASWLRGVRLITVPTTLLGMVDAAVGGKTGINTPAGKNLVGAFYEPIGVLCDLDLLHTLPVADLRAGLAEVIKTGFIADPEILSLVEAAPQSCLDPAAPVLAELVERSIVVKARVVGDDLRESTSVGDRVGRELLNYGHTLAHAIERRENYQRRHGEAVAIGSVFAAELSHAAGLLDADTTMRHRTVFASVGLPTTYPAEAFDELLPAMAMDKKTRGSTLRFVVLKALAHARILVGPDEALLRQAYARISA
ncbi:MAG: 3-dehydroquinate synthase [Propionibacteriaceae bacterium]